MNGSLAVRTHASSLSEAAALTGSGSSSQCVICYVSVLAVSLFPTLRGRRRSPCRDLATSQGFPQRELVGKPFGTLASRAAG
jgi:hypothetical protein